MKPLSTSLDPVRTYPDVIENGDFLFYFMHFIRYAIQTVFHPSSGLHNCREFYQPLSCLYEAMQIQNKRFL